MALWRKFSNILKNKRSSFSRSFTSDVFGQLQHWTLPAPARSDLVGLVLSSMSISPVAEIRSGILSSDSRESNCLGMCIVCLHRGSYDPGSLQSLPAKGCLDISEVSTVGSTHTRGFIHTFGAVVVMVELSVLRLPLPADQVVCQIAVGKGRR